MQVKTLKSTATKGFLLLAGINREIIPAQVSKLAKSLNTMGCIRPVVVAEIDFLSVKGKYIVDGQHLFNALLRNDMSIPYVEIQVQDKRDLINKIALLNSSSKSWQTSDYIMSWSSINPNYEKLREYFNIYDIDYASLAAILMGRSSDGGGLGNVIKRGEFKIINEAENRVLLDYVTDVLKSVPRGNRAKNRYVCKEFVDFYRAKGKKYVHSKFIQGLMKKRDQLELVTHEPGNLIKLFESI